MIYFQFPLYPFPFLGVGVGSILRDAPDFSEAESEVVTEPILTLSTLRIFLKLHIA